MKNNTKKLLCILLALAAVVCIIVACFTLSRRKQTDSASSGSASSTAASVSQFGSVADFDYETFDYSDGLDENGYWSGIKALDYVTLPEDFGSIALKESDLTPTEDELQQQMDSLLNQYTTSQPVTGRAAQSGDVANIDYTGTVDGVAFTGGTATGYDLTLGSGSFIDGFEDQIIGHNVGDTFDVTVTFPDGYGDSTDAEGNTITLSGKEAVFSVTLNSLSENVTPELTDEWVESNFGVSDDLHTADQLRSYFSGCTVCQQLRQCHRGLPDGQFHLQGAACRDHQLLHPHVPEPLQPVRHRLQHGSERLCPDAGLHQCGCHAGRFGCLF